MADVGEELVGAWLREIKNCDFVQYNVLTGTDQGEIDVVGLNLKTKEVYLCEVATHLITGLQYVKNKQPNNVEKLTQKFSNDIRYAHQYLHEFQQYFMLWSPIVKFSKGKHNQITDLAQIRHNIRQEFHIEVEFIVNEQYQACVKQLQERAAKVTEASKFPVFRLLQILEHLKRHVIKLEENTLEAVQKAEDGLVQNSDTTP